MSDYKLFKFDWKIGIPCIAMGLSMCIISALVLYGEVIPNKVLLSLIIFLYGLLAITETKGKIE